MATPFVVGLLAIWRDILTRRVEMLRLTRRSGEKLILETDNGTIRISFYIKNGQIKLGIRAPQSVNVIRGELLEGDENKEGD